MQRRLFYTSPVDHHRLEDWPPLGRALQKAAQAECGADTEISVGGEPVFGYGTDVEETLAAFDDEPPKSREVRIELWCSICLYATLAVTLGTGIRRQERRGLVRRLKKLLPGQVLLREHEGPYDGDSGRLYGYSLSSGDDKDRSTIDELLMPMDPPIYLGEHWLVQDDGGRIDTESFEVIRQLGPNLVIFLTRTKQAEERIWASCGSGEGLIALPPDDPAEASLIRRFSQLEDLRIFLAEAPSAAQRVTIERCHQDDCVVAVYGPSWAPEIEAPILFMI